MEPVVSVQDVREVVLDDVTYQIAPLTFRQRAAVSAAITRSGNHMPAPAARLAAVRAAGAEVGDDDADALRQAEAAHAGDPAVAEHLAQTQMFLAEQAIALVRYGLRGRGDVPLPESVIDVLPSGHVEQLSLAIFNASYLTPATEKN